MFVWLFDSNISEVELGALVDASTGSLGCLNVSYACGFCRREGFEL